MSAGTPDVSYTEGEFDKSLVLLRGLVFDGRPMVEFQIGSTDVLISTD